MNRILKIFLSLLLALALPMQGYAAATMFSCGAAHAHFANASNDNLSMRHASHEAGDVSHQHHVSMRHVPDSHDSSDHFGQHGHSSCSTCAVCCIGIALTPAAPVWHPPHDAKDSHYISLAVSFSGHVPPGIDRPPRAILA
jgi:hypothetical protein